MGYCINCKKCDYPYDTKYFPEFCPNCYIKNDEESCYGEVARKLKEAEKVIEFYGEGNSASEYNRGDFEYIGDSLGMPRFLHGKAAREYLAKYKQGKE